MESKQNKSTKVKALLEEGKSVVEIAKEVGCNKALVYMVRKAHFPKLGRKYKTSPRKKLMKLVKSLDLTPNTSLDEIRDRLPADMRKLIAGIAKKKLAEGAAVRGLSGRTYTPVETTPVTKDMVNSPAHYTKGGIEVYDFIKAKGLSYELGNVVKYVSRADLKGNELEDLMKARWYLDAAIRVAGGAI